MAGAQEQNKPHEIEPDRLPEDLGKFAILVIKALDSLALPHGRYRLVGSAAVILHGIRLDTPPLTEEMLLEAKRPSDLDILVTTAVMDMLGTAGQTPGGIKVGNRYFGQKLSTNVLLTTIDDSPINLPIDYIDGYYRGSMSRYNRSVTSSPYDLLGEHKVITLKGITEELESREINAKTIRDRQAIREQAGI